MHSTLSIAGRTVSTAPLSKISADDTQDSTARLSGTSQGMQQVGSHRNLTLARKLNTFRRTPT